MSPTLAFGTFLVVSTVTVEDAEFLGFSHDEGLAAWQLVLTEDTPRGPLRYPLVQVVESSTLKIVGEFRIGAARHAKSGRVVPPRRSASQRWRAAKGLSAWQELATREEIGLSPLAEISDQTRVALNRGYLSDRKGGLHFAGAAGIEFLLRVDLTNGGELQLGRFGHPDAERARVRVYSSPTGHHVAIECALTLGPKNRRAETVLRRLVGFPLRARPAPGPIDPARVRVIYGEDAWGFGYKGGPKGYAVSLNLER